MTREGKNVLLVGVGGQGTILASKVLSEGLLSFGYDVKMSEIHGMAQRGGSVSTHVRYGERVFSPVISKGEVDILVAFEKMEALRWLPYISGDGMLIVNNQEIFPMPVILGQAEYPFQLEKTLSEAVSRCVVIEAAKEAEEIGDPRVMNMVLLGAVVKKLGLDEMSWEETLRTCVPQAAFQPNLLAFEKGMKLAE
ncbi:indolepyruvate oxidoreductase subunit beta [Aminivibrio sp.]|jgi:indolepyruvate ferredoxin oxidoreductase beta subunit|uniref:indolepyruvate oxidoreductase subunit beta n=1 Tax=Aminivibrio sp. TaxID=1872489 RepID=UPI00168E7318|nr:indolepyruvate oxidoreductase subunit beta [Synergistaceae bacterium]